MTSHPASFDPDAPGAADLMLLFVPLIAVVVLFLLALAWAVSGAVASRSLRRHPSLVAHGPNARAAWSLIVWVLPIIGPVAYGACWVLQRVRTPRERIARVPDPMFVPLDVLQAAARRRPLALS